MKLAIPVCLLLSAFVFLNAQEPIEDTDILDMQREVLMQNYPHVFLETEIIDVEVMSDRHSRVIYFRDGQRYEVVVNNAREDLLLLTTSRQISRREVPEPVMAAFGRSGYKDWVIDRAFVTTTPYSSEFYRLDVYKDENKNEVEIVSVFYDKLGKPIKAPYGETHRKELRSEETVK